MAGKDMIDSFDERDQRTIDAAERDLAAVLAVEPSPEFRARVRARIEAAPEPRRWWTWPSALAAAASLVIVVAGAAALMRTGDGRRQPEAVSIGRPTADGSGRVPPKPDSIEAGARALESAGSPPQTRGSNRQVRHTPRAAPEAGVSGVIVDRAQADAIRRLLDVARRAPRDTAVDLPAEPGPPDVQAIPLAPMAVEPLQVPDIKTGTNGSAGL